MDFNSSHQLWSRWAFTVREGGRHVPRADVELNVARWLRAGFGSAGAARVEPTLDGWRITALIEGMPAHDPGFVQSVREQFQERFVAPGWGIMAWSHVEVAVLAGDVQDGRPRAQLVAMPAIPRPRLPQRWG